MNQERIEGHRAWLGDLMLAQEYRRGFRWGFAAALLLGFALGLWLAPYL